MLDTIDRKGIASLSPAQVEELFGLYRLVSSDLNLVQTRTANAALLESLEHLVARAYANLAVPRRSNVFSAWWRVVRSGFPAAVRAERRLLGWATATMVCGFLFGFLATQINPDHAETFVGSFPHLLEDPSERVASLEAEQRQGHTPAGQVGHHVTFSTQLATHNIRVTVLAFTLGLSFGVLTVAVLFFNSVLLGSATALYWADGQIMFLVAWLGPHGSIELPCVAFAGTAGLMLARAQLRRDQGTTLSQIRRIRPRLVDLIIGTATLLVVAGVVEGGFSQIHEPVLPYPFKIAVALALFTGLVGYLFLMPLGRQQQEPADGLGVHLPAVEEPSAGRDGFG